MRSRSCCLQIINPFLNKSRRKISTCPVLDHAALVGGDDDVGLVAKHDAGHGLAVDLQGVEGLARPLAVVHVHEGRGGVSHRQLWDRVPGLVDLFYLF